MDLRNFIRNTDIIYTIKCNLKLKAKRLAWLAHNETNVGLSSDEFKTEIISLLLNKEVI